MKKIYSFFIFCSLSTIAFSQHEKCGTISHRDANVLNTPGYAEGIRNAEAIAGKWLAENKTSLLAQAKTQTLVTIPVVFHCVYKNTSDPTYVADSTFVRQIEIMNQTYSKTNPNYSNTRALFDSLGADVEIQFCFAGVDPQGNGTSGIVRYQSGSNWFSSVVNNQIKTTYPPWDPSKYLNIWTCDMKFFGQFAVLGYATFPGGNPSLDGVVLQSEFVGYQNNGTSNNLGRTMVHEVGHWLGLRHIWGDGQNGSNPCDSTDYVDDTPRANNASQTDCDTTKNTCSNEDAFWSSLSIDPPDMVENYMDYSNDACMTLFTKGQKARMWSFLNTLRSALLTNTVPCGVIGIKDYTPAFSEFIDIFPNPASGSINVNFRTSGISGITVAFFNSTGQFVKSIQVHGLQNQVNTKDLSPGIYFLKISNANNVALRKIIVD